MGVLDKVRIIIYRFHEKGLEVFLLNSDIDNDPDAWKLPEGFNQENLELMSNDTIQLDHIKIETGDTIPTIAIQADWHEIPSVRGIIKHDVKRVKNKIKETLPCVEKGGYFCVKEAVKKVLPNEYKAVKELKDILLDRNVVTNI